MRRRLLLTQAIPPPIEKYLIVSPSEVQWINEENPVIYNIESNTEWLIE